MRQDIASELALHLDGCICIVVKDFSLSNSKVLLFRPFTLAFALRGDAIRYIPAVM